MHVYIKPLQSLIFLRFKFDDEESRYKNKNPFANPSKLVLSILFCPWVPFFAFFSNHRNHANRTIFNNETIKLSRMPHILPGLACSLIETYFWTLLSILSWTIVCLRR